MLAVKMATSPTRTKLSDQGNMDVDYVISYRFATTGTA